MGTFNGFFSFYPHGNHMKAYFLSSPQLYRWGNWGSERLSNLFRTTVLIGKDKFVPHSVTTETKFLPLRSADHLKSTYLGL